jgi:energy-coupling factor transporter transmembrane protein EcfT
MAAVFVSALLWIMCFSQVLDFEAQLFLVRPVSGAVSLVLSMCARMLERFKAKIASMQDGRRGLGMCAQGGFTARLRHAADIVGALSGWVFEDAMVAADSMMARGFAAKNRTSIRCYVMRAKDWYLLVVTILGVVAYFACAAVGWGQWPGALGAANLHQVVFGWVMFALCLIYMLSFSVVVAGEELQWQLYLLKM